MLNDVIFKVLTVSPDIGTTSVTFTDPLINDNSIIEIYFTNDDFVYTDVHQNNNSVTIEYEELTTNIGIALFINNCDTFAPYDDTSISTMVAHNTSNILLINGHLSELNTKIDNLSSNDISYDNTTSGLDADNVQDAIDILSSGGGGSADDISYDNTTSGLDADNVQDALDELSTRNTIQIYDATERVIGTWFNKPLYRKTYTGTTGNVSNRWVMGGDSSYNIKSINGVVANVKFPTYFTNDNFLQGYIENGLLVLYGSDAYYSNKPYNITLEYTKVGD